MRRNSEHDLPAGSQVAELLLDRGARLDVVDQATGENLLHLAVNGQSAGALAPAARSVHSPRNKP